MKVSILEYRIAALLDFVTDVLLINFQLTRECVLLRLTSASISNATPELKPFN